MLSSGKELKKFFKGLSSKFKSIKEFNNTILKCS